MSRIQVWVEVRESMVYLTSNKVFQNRSGFVPFKCVQDHTDAETCSYTSLSAKPIFYTIFTILMLYFRSKSRAELLRISAAVMGIEFCYAAETAFVSPTLLSIGTDSYMPPANRRCHCMFVDGGVRVCVCVCLGVLCSGQLTRITKVQE